VAKKNSAQFFSVILCPAHFLDHQFPQTEQFDVRLSDLRTRYDGIVSLEGCIRGEGEKVLIENMAYLRRLGFVRD
jgi:hypothetical protein